MKPGIYTYRDKHTPIDLIIYIEVLPFILYKSGANAFIWNDRSERKQLIFIDKFISKNLTQL